MISSGKENANFCVQQPCGCFVILITQVFRQQCRCSMNCGDGFVGGGWRLAKVPFSEKVRGPLREEELVHLTTGKVY